MLSLKLGSYHGLELSLDADTAGSLVTAFTTLFDMQRGRVFMSKVKAFGASFLRVYLRTIPAFEVGASHDTWP